MLDQWNIAFPNSEPVAHLMRKRFADRWVRFHSLPESKRYPESEDEFGILIDRHHAVLNSLVRAGSKVILITTEFSRVGGEPPPPKLMPNANLWRTFAMEEFAWHVYAQEISLNFAMLDPIIRTVAIDAVGEVMLIDPECRWIYHPYDGGMDLILEAPAARDELKMKFAEWLSRLPSGL
jgi:hypothetical protein